MKTVLAIWLVLVLPTLCVACDVCGIFLGIQPNDRANSFSLFYRYRHLDGNFQVPITSANVLKHGDEVISTSEQTRAIHYRELYQVAEFRSEFWIGNKVAMLVSVPLVNNYQAIDDVRTTDIYGVGDPLFIARYQVVNTKCLTPDERVVHRLMVGAGAKVPLGVTNAQYRGAEVHVDQQPGSGSWDGLASLEYKVRYKRNGAGVSAIARYNTANSNKYQLGHGLSTTAEFFRRYDVGENWKVMPSIGAYHEWSGMDAEHNETVQGTGSSTLFSHVGTRLWWRSWGITLTYQHALLRDMGVVMVPNKERIVAGVTFNINAQTN